MNNYPKILIFGQPFNNYSGGGITLTNLFKGWPKDKIAVAAIGHLNQFVATDVCDTYYQLGNEEHKWKFPFNLIQRSFPSGLLTFTRQESSTPVIFRANLRHFFVDRIFYPLIHWLGLFHCLSEISMSPRFKNWLAEYKPEILYIQVTTREAVLFSMKLCDYLKIPSVIHNMDDWPSTISKDGLFKDYWNNKIDKEFRQLLDRIDLYLSISHAMSEEYLKRYNKVFTPFHNPIDIQKFNEADNRVESTDGIFRVLYIGRVGVANKNSIFAFAKAVAHFDSDRYKVEFDIYSAEKDTLETKGIDNMRNVRIFSPVKHEMIHMLLKEYDLLFLPLDFNENGFKYAQFSIPTKASEYMISGTPILVFAPKETAISKFCSENECAYCLIEEGDEKISEALHFMIDNAEYRKKVSSKAMRLAAELFDGEKVRREFQQLIINIPKGENYVHK
jgi:glycosyltransferase involved in cell wall biosynthesis